MSTILFVKVVCRKKYKIGLQESRLDELRIICDALPSASQI